MADLPRTLLQFDRRSLLKGMAGCVLAPAVLRAGPARAQYRKFPFSLGIASGDPAPDGFVIWTRLAPEPLAEDGGMGSDAAEVTWEVAADQNMQRVVRLGTATARVESAHSIHVEIDGLEPGRDYFYRFRTGTADSVVGRVRTLPASGAAVSELRFASAGCQRWQDGYYTAWRRIAEEQFDFVFHYGDYIYEGATTKPERQGRGLLRAMPGDFGECVTLADYRLRYSLYKTDRDLQAAHASCAFLPSFDDHEVAGDWSADAQARQSLNTPFLPRRAAAFQAWYEHMPLRAANMPHGPDILAYRSFRFGNLAEVAVLDTRQYRSYPVCHHFDNCAASHAPDRTMMGAAQEQWLSDTFRASLGVWQVLAQQVNFAQLDWRSFPNHHGRGPELRMDSWDGASAGRERVLQILKQVRAENPVVLSGDLHRAIALEISSDPKDPSGPCAAVEFLSTSISSGGNGRLVTKNADAIARDNPHIKWLSSERGYTRHIVKPKTWQADYRAVASITKRDAPIVTRQSLVVEAGKPGLVRA
jgi:alkaline phosphatase D